MLCAILELIVAFYDDRFNSGDSPKTEHDFYLIHRHFLLSQRAFGVNAASCVKKYHFLCALQSYRTLCCMVAKVKLLMDKVVQIEIKKKHYELKVLQTQIQPHFLYNTLNAISYLA